jgi:hypothetical protein
MARKPVLKTGLVRTAQSFAITHQKPTLVTTQDKNTVKQTTMVKIV